MTATAATSARFSTTPLPSCSRPSSSSVPPPVAAAAPPSLADDLTARLTSAKPRPNLLNGQHDDLIPSAFSSTPVSTPPAVPASMPFFGGTVLFLPRSSPSRPLDFIVPSSPSPALITRGDPAAAMGGPSAEVRAARAALDLKCHARARIPTPHGQVFLHLYKTSQDSKEHLAIVYDPAQLARREARRGDIRSRSLDAVWREGETEMERLIRGAYVGRLDESGGVASKPPLPAAGEDQQEMEGEEPRRLDPPLVRIHSECFTGETIGSARCDCGEQLDESLRLIALPSSASRSSSAALPPPSSPSPRGVIVYLRQEGRGIGLLSKLLAYNLQDMGHDTVSANVALGHGADERKWDVAGGILADLGFGGGGGEGGGGEGVRLMTNNPDKVEGLKGEGVRVVERVGMVPRSWDAYPHSTTISSSSSGPALSSTLGGKLHGDEDEEREKREWAQRQGGLGLLGGMETRSVELDRYLRTKIERMGHLLTAPPLVDEERRDP